jgi:UDP-N-acetylmuramate dehydrogenase
MLITENRLLAPFTTFGIGGPARWFVEADSEGEIEEAVRWVRERGVRLFVLGGGSNLLVSDAGFLGLVLRGGLRGVAVEAVGGAGEFKNIPQGLKHRSIQAAWKSGLKP